VAVALAGVVLATTLITTSVVGASSASSSSARLVTDVDLKMAHAYTPPEAPGTTDD
jgi:hypothetical protein